VFFDKNERRTFARMKVDCDITYRHINDANVVDSKIISGTGKNISGNGILFTTKEPLKPGNKLELNVVPRLKEVTPPLSAIVNVIRVIPENTPGRYTVGGAFDKIY